MADDAVAKAIHRVERRVESSSLDKGARRRVRNLATRMAHLNAAANEAASANASEAGSPRARGARAKAGSAPDARPGQAVAAAMYMIIESLLVRIEADRMSLFLVNERTYDLQLAVSAGIGAQRPGKNSHPPLSTGLLNLCAQTGIAVNLPTVSLEDIADCPGPRGRNALIFPVRREANKPETSIGAIIAVNHRKGTSPFTVDDEVTLADAAPSIAYLARQYPVDWSAMAFDFAALHRVRPLETWAPPKTQLPDGWSIQHAQLVYHREGPEKYIRREDVTASAPGTDSAAATKPLESVASHLQTVAEYIASLKECWRQTVEQQMDVERQVRQRQALVTDAQEILHRKQAKLKHIKDELCEHLEAQATADTAAEALRSPQRGVSEASSGPNSRR